MKRHTAEARVDLEIHLDISIRNTIIQVGDKQLCCLTNNPSTGSSSSSSSLSPSSFKSVVLPFVGGLLRLSEEDSSIPDHCMLASVLPLFFFFFCMLVGDHLTQLACISCEGTTCEDTFNPIKNMLFPTNNDLHQDHADGSVAEWHVK